MAKSPKSLGSADQKSQDFLTGQLLIAMPNMSDPRFGRSVLLMCAHDANHAMGVIVNKPLADVELGELLEQLSIDTKDGVGADPVRFGGPVQTERGLVLHSLDYCVDATIEVCPGIGLTATREILVDIAGRESLRPPPSRFFLAIGHAGWDAGQLEEEIALNAWAHCEPDEAIVFTNDAENTWRRALQRLGVTGAMLSPEWSAPRPEDAPLN